MFEQVSTVLEQAIGELDIPADAAALTHCARLLDRLSAKVTAAVAAFDAAEAWRDDGATSMTAWLRRHTAASSRDAARLARTARRLAGLPVTAAAYQGGELSGGQVQAIVTNLNDQTAPVFADAETELVPQLARLAVKDVSHVMQAWAAAARDHLQPDPADDQRPEPAGPERTLHLSETLDGRGELSGSFDPEARAVTETALRLAETPDSDTEPPRSPARRRADALVDVLRFFLDHQTTRTGGRHRPHLNIVVDYEDLTADPDGSGDPSGSGGPGGSDGDDDLGGCPPARSSAQLLDGTLIDTTTLHRLACDAGVHRVVMAGRSSILDYGHTTRTIPANLWAAVAIRDRHCRFPGCDRPPQWCEAHHIQPWEHGGPTTSQNLGLFCTRHHHVLHSPGWHATIQPDGTIHITDPRSRVHTSEPPGKTTDLFTQRPPPTRHPTAA